MLSAYVLVEKIMLRLSNVVRLKNESLYSEKVLRFSLRVRPHTNGSIQEYKCKHTRSQARSKIIYKKNILRIQKFHFYFAFLLSSVELRAIVCVSLCVQCLVISCVSLCVQLCVFFSVCYFICMCLCVLFRAFV